jgi:Na+/H+ antiporter NhaD/arsenite permease-like protein
MSQQNPFANPLFRYGVALSGALVVAFVAYSYLEGTTQLVAYAVAALDLLVTPQILKRAGAQ